MMNFAWMANPEKHLDNASGMLMLACGASTTLTCMIGKSHLQNKFK
jgi:hypothetical protein